MTGTILTSINSLDVEGNLLYSDKSIKVEFIVTFKLLLEAGSYTMDSFLGITKGKNEGLSIFKKSIGPINVQWDYHNHTAPFLGKFGLPVEKEIKHVDSTDEN